MGSRRCRNYRCELIKIEKIWRKNKIKKIIIILAISTLILAGIFVGGVNENTNIIQIMIGITTILCIIENRRNKGNNLFQKKDIIICIFCLSPTIPLIFKSYISLQGTIESILRYLSLFLIYINMKYVIREYPKKISFITYVIIIITIIQFFIGIDYMTTKITEPFLDMIGIKESLTEEKRLDSVFQYANTFAMMCGLSLILALGKYTKGNRKIFSNLLFVYITILEAGIILSYSRLVWILLLFIAILYFLCLKKNKKIETFTASLVGGILAVLYSNLYSKYLLTGEYIKIWIYTLILIIISFFIHNILYLINKKLEKISLRKIVISSICISIIGIGIIAIGLTQTEPLVLFNKDTSEKQFIKEIYNVKGNIKYTFEINYQLKSSKNNRIQIIIEERNKYFDVINETKIDLEECERQTKTISIDAQEDTNQIYIKFSAKDVGNQNKLVINNLKINQKEEIVKYKYLPLSLVDKIKNINFQTKSVWERFNFVKDAIKLIKENFIFGTGGDSWKYLQKQVQDYAYGAKEVHNYYIEIFLEFGIVGFISFLLIMIQVVKNCIIYLRKDVKDIENIALIMAFTLLMFHSGLDFDLSYFYVQILLFIFITVLLKINCLNNIKNNALYEINNKKQDLLEIFIIIGICIFILINIGYTKINLLAYKLEMERNIEKKQRIIDEINSSHLYNGDVLYEDIFQQYENDSQEQIQENLRKVEKYLTYEKHQVLQVAYRGLNYYIELEEEYREKNITIKNKILEKILDSEIEEKYFANYLLQRQKAFLEIINIYSKQENIEKEFIIDLKAKVYKEYLEMRENISDYQKCRYKKEKREERIQEIDKMYKDFCIIYDNLIEYAK